MHETSGEKIGYVKEAAKKGAQEEISEKGRNWETVQENREGTNKENSKIFLEIDSKMILRRQLEQERDKWGSGE